MCGVVLEVRKHATQREGLKIGCLYVESVSSSFRVAALLDADVGCTDRLAAVARRGRHDLFGMSPADLFGDRSEMPKTIGDGPRAYPMVSFEGQ